MIGNLLFIFLIQGFVQKWVIPQGINYGAGRMLIADTDRDGNWEFIFSTYGNSRTIYFYELHLPNHWEIDSATELNGHLLWDNGDFDADGLCDVVIQWGRVDPPTGGIAVFESPDSFSYPTQEVWLDTMGAGGVIPILAYDVDRDGLSEIFKLCWLKYDSITVYYDFGIYESVGNNLYDTIFMYTGPLGTPMSTIAFGDFDADGRIEFVLGDTPTRYEIWECIGDNSYEMRILQQVPIPCSIDEAFTVGDADGDGKLEFILKGHVLSILNVNTFIYEATGDNTYELVKYFILPNGAYNQEYYQGYSDTGDLDGDGRAEIALEAASYVYLIKGVGNDSFMIWHTLPGNPDGSSVRVFDIDNNGLSEIIISGGNYTRIYEKTPFVTWLCPEPYDTFYANDTVYPRWRLDETIGIDSLRLYWSHPQMGCHLIYQGLATDTICSWVVPDTQSNMSNKFWLVVKGLSRYDSIYSPVFYIKRTPGIEEAVSPQSALGDQQFTIHPNPFDKNLTIKFHIPVPKFQILIKIYNVSGRLVRQWDDQRIRQSNYVVWDGRDEEGRKVSSGVYFLTIEDSNTKEILSQKVIKVE